MSTQTLNTREMEITRLLDARPDQIFAAWQDPNLFPQWWAPKPVQTTFVQIDPRAGGVLKTVMQLPDGQKIPTHGVFLEFGPEKIVFTDAFVDAWTPKEGAPFMVATITLQPEGEGTRYTARVQHWTEEACKEHEQMGFHGGWNICISQLEEVARGL